MRTTLGLLALALCLMVLPASAEEAPTLAELPAACPAPELDLEADLDDLFAPEARNASCDADCTEDSDCVNACGSGSTCNQDLLLCESDSSGPGPGPGPRRCPIYELDCYSAAQCIQACPGATSAICTQDGVCIY